MDLRFSRVFSFREHHKLELAADAFNIMNRDNVDEVDSVYTSPDFCGAAPHSYNDAVSKKIQNSPLSFIGTCSGGVPFPNPDFGKPRKVFNARQFQVSFRYTF